MTENIYWMNPDRKEVWSYDGRLYRTERKAMEQYQGRVRFAESSVRDAERYVNDPRYTYWYQQPEKVEQARIRLENIKAKKPRHITLVWDDQDG